MRPTKLIKLVLRVAASTRICLLLGAVARLINRTSSTTLTAPFVVQGEGLFRDLRDSFVGSASVSRPLMGSQFVLGEKLKPLRHKELPARELLEQNALALRQSVVSVELLQHRETAPLVGRQLGVLDLLRDS